MARSEQAAPLVPRKVGHGALDFLSDFRFDPDVTLDIAERIASLRSLGMRPFAQFYHDVQDYAPDAPGTGAAKEAHIGGFYTWLVETHAPGGIVEFGTAFGASGMYFLRGLERLGRGGLTTYEPNEEWITHARQNLARVSDRFTLIQDTFENARHATLQTGSVGIALIDAIHTSAFVTAQFDLLKPYLAPGAIVLFDDIYFSADMASGWAQMAQRDDIAASAEFGRRVGIVRLPD